MRKLYAVAIATTLMVVADSQAEAERIAEQNYREETTLEMCAAQEVAALDGVPADWRGSIPYGPSNGLTCAEFLADDATAATP